MATIADKLSKIISLKSDMVKNLNTKGVTSASDSEKFNTLVAKVLTIGDKNEYKIPPTGSINNPNRSQKLGALYNQKNLLADYISSMGVSASRSEKLNTLVPKILDIEVEMFKYYIAFKGSYAGFNETKILTAEDIAKVINFSSAYEYLGYFRDWKSLTAPSFGRTSAWVTQIDSNAFKETLTKIPIATTASNLGKMLTIDLSKLSGIPTEAFASLSLSFTVHFSSLPDCLYISDYAMTDTEAIGGELLIPKCSLIGWYALRGTKTYLVKGDEIKEIGGFAFGNVETLRYAYIPKIEIVRTETFYGCHNLQCLYGEGSESTPSVSTTGITSIGYYAFAGCSKIRYVAVSNTLKGFPAGAFYNCSSLITISPSFSMASYGPVDLASVSYVSASAFNGCKSLMGYLSTPNLNRVEDAAFCNCYKLWGIDLTNVTEVSQYAFYDDYNIRRFVYGTTFNYLAMPSCTYVGSHAFELKYTRADDDGTKTDLWHDTVTTYITDLSLPECSYIGSAAFKERLGLYRVYIPKVEYIGSAAFSALNLTADSMIGYTDMSMISSLYLPVCSYIGSFAFAGCELRRDLSLPNAKYIGDHAFDHTLGQLVPINFSSPFTLTLPGNCYIGSWAFSNQFISSVVFLGDPPSQINDGVFWNSLVRDYAYFSYHTFIGNAAFSIDPRFSRSMHFTNLESIGTKSGPIHLTKSKASDNDFDIFLYKNNNAGVKIASTVGSYIASSRYIYVKDLDYYKTNLPSFASRFKQF